jgi:glycogen(starch) synthase
LASLGHEVTVVAPGNGASSPTAAPANGPVRVITPSPADPIVPLAVGDLHGHVATLGTALARAAIRVGRNAERSGRPFDVLCAHDWVVAQAATTVAAALELPLVTTIHATEAGRHQGWLPGDLSRSIHATEGWLAAGSNRVLVCSEAMRRDVQRLFAVPDEQVRVVPNGVDLTHWRCGAPVRDREPLVVFAGRLEYEKGVQVLLRTVPRLRRRVPGVSFVIAGTGTYETELHALARRLRLSRAVRFAGHLRDGELKELYRSAAAVAVPSIYEPFGLVALEAAACGAPLVVSETGGLAEFADGGRTAVPVAPEDVSGLADALTELLRDRDLADKLASSARDVAEMHDWHHVARRSTEVYREAMAEAASGISRAASPLVEPPRDVNLLR